MKSIEHQLCYFIIIIKNTVQTKIISLLDNLYQIIVLKDIIILPYLVMLVNYMNHVLHINQKIMEWISQEIDINFIKY